MEVGNLKVSLILENGQFKLAVKDSENALRSLETHFDKVGKRVNQTESHIHAITRGFRNFVITVGAARFALMDINDVFLSIPAAVLRVTGEFERLEKLMEGLSSASTEAGKKLEASMNVKYLQQLSQNAPFALKNLTDSFVKFKSAGLDPLDGSFQALVDGVARFGGTGDQMNRASIAIQQMAGKGVISMEELRQQLGEAIPTAMSTMAASMGLTMGELADQIKKGIVTAQPALERMALLMGIENRGAANDMMQTWVGMLQLLKSRTDVILSDMGKDSGFAESAKKALQSIIDLVGSPELKDFGLNIAEGFALITQKATEAVQYIIRNGTEIWNVMKMIGVLWATMKAIDLASGMRSFVVETRRAYMQTQQSILLARKEEAEAARVAQAKIAAATLAAHQKSVLAAQETATVVAALKEQEAAQAAHNARLQAAMAQQAAVARQAGGALMRQYGSPGGATVANAIDEMKKEKVAIDAKVAALQAEAAARRAAFIEAEKARAGAALGVTAINSVGNAATNTATSLTRMERTLIGMRMAFNAVGGWVTVLVIAVEALAFAWMKVTNRAKEAMEAQERARRGTSTKEDLDKRIAARDQEQERVTNLEAAIMRQEVIYGQNPTKRQTERLNQLRESLKNARQELQKESANVREIENVVMNREIEAGAQGIFAKAEADAIAQQRSIEMKAKAARDNIKKELEASGKKPAKDDESTFRTNLAKDMQKGYVDSLKYSQQQVAFELDKLISEGKKDTLRARELNKAYGDLGNAVKTAEETLKKTGMFGSAVYQQKDKEGKGEKGKKDKDPVAPMPDKWGEFITEQRGQLEDANIKLAGVMEQMRDFEGRAVEMDRLRQRALAFLKKKIDKKDFDFTYDGKNYEIGEQLSRNPTEVARVAEIMARADAANRSAAAFTELHGIIVRTAQGYREFAETLEAGDRNEMPSSMLRLERTLDGIRSKLVTGTEELKEFESLYLRLMELESGVQIGRLGLKLRDETRKMNAELVEDPIVRIRQQADEEIRIQARTLNTIREMRERYGDKDGMYQFAENEIIARVQAIANRANVAMRSPIEKLAVEWKNAFRSIESAQVQWMDGFVNTIIDGVAQGKIEIGSLVKSIMIDLGKIKLKETLSQGMGESMDMISNFLADALGIKKPNVNPKIDIVAMKSADSLAMLAGTSDTAQFKVGQLAIAAANAAQALTQIGVASGLGKWMGDDFGFVSNLVPGTATTFADALMEGIIPLAKGGVVGSMGSIPLRKYAKGGIADSPQLALFGEGAHREAYVPLPDGRSIPVTMNGAAPNVQVNVINQSGQPVDAVTSQPRFDGRQMILDVVLSAAGSPGKFRDGLKGALGQ